jgi:hypothetical protein
MVAIDYQSMLPDPQNLYSSYHRQTYLTRPNRDTATAHNQRISTIADEDEDLLLRATNSGQTTASPTAVQHLHPESHNATRYDNVNTIARRNLTEAECWIEIATTTPQMVAESYRTLAGI